MHSHCTISAGRCQQSGPYTLTTKGQMVRFAPPAGGGAAAPLPPCWLGPPPNGPANGQACKRFHMLPAPGACFVPGRCYSESSTEGEAVGSSSMPSEPHCLSTPPRQPVAAAAVPTHLPDASRQALGKQVRVVGCSIAHDMRKPGRAQGGTEHSVVGEGGRQLAHLRGGRHGRVAQQSWAQPKP